MTEDKRESQQNKKKEKKTNYCSTGGKRWKKSVKKKAAAVGSRGLACRNSKSDDTATPFPTSPPTHVALSLTGGPGAHLSSTCTRATAAPRCPVRFTVRGCATDGATKWRKRPSNPLRIYGWVPSWPPLLLPPPSAWTENSWLDNSFDSCLARLGSFKFVNEPS